MIKDVFIFEKKISETAFLIEIGSNSYQLFEIDEVIMKEESDSLVFEFVVGEDKTVQKFEK